MTEADVSLSDAVAEDTTPADSSSGDSASNDSVSNDTAPKDTSPVCPGGAGCPCDANDDCDAGLCLEGADGNRCGKPCVDACDAGFTCAQIPQGSDLVTVCVDAWARLCSPCESTKDCNHPGVTGARCVDRGAAGAFCGAACKADGDCPTGYACKDTTDVDGNGISQCLPVDDGGELAACACSNNAVSLALKTTCSKAVVSGDKELTCAGQAQCKEAGQAAECKANDPADETCDGADNDCDGETDEGSCDDGNPCTTDSCDPDNGCTNLSLSDGAGCDADGSVCTEGDSCQGGKCVAGAAKNCDDKNPCTQDSCELATGCTQVADDGAPCDDDSPCTIGDVCKDGGCKAGKAKECTAPNSCYTAACDVVTGKCAFDYAVKGLPCNDDNACTTKDGCDQGKCKGTVVQCDDSNPCTDDSCDPKTGCVYKANTAPCEDGDKCTLNDKCAKEQCVSGKAKACDDSEVCTVDSCDSKTGDCVFNGLPKEATPCDADGSVCTVGDACKSGKCLAGAKKDCDDGNVCTTEGCDAKTGCTHAANTAACSDKDGCTLADQCKDKACVAGKAKVCDDKELCTADSCDSKTGDCVFDGKAQQAKACDADGSVCTVSDACDAGKCIAGKKKVCDDGDVCTDDGCDAKTGCTKVNNTAKCDDKDACTDKDTCAAGACKGAKVTCDDKNPCTTDTCDKAKGCQTASVKDETPCTSGAGVSWCQAGKCVPKTAGGKPCTTGKQCASGYCVDGVCCDGACDKGCLSCLAKHTGALDGQCKPVKVGTDPDNDCNAMDASTCGFTGVCDGAGQCAKYKAGTVCKAAGCAGTTHTAEGVCGASGCVAGKTTGCDDSNACTEDLCDAKQVCVHKETGKACDDKDACTEKDVCGVAGTSKVYTGAAPKGFGVCQGGKVMCDDKNPCTTDSCDGVKGCQATAVKDETSCSQDGSKWCQAGKCVVKAYCGLGVPNKCSVIGTAAANEQVAKLLANDGATYDYFGFSISISGGRAVIGAYADDDKGSASGSAYVYERQATSQWKQVAKLTAGDGAANDWFGRAVSISGDRVVVGARQDDAKGSASGSAYIFQRSANGQWKQAAKLTAADGTVKSYFGHAVSISGERVVIAASGITSSSGAVYVFERKNTGEWQQVQKLTAGSNWFGNSVSLSGERVLIGAYGDSTKGADSGAAYVFERNSKGSWGSTAVLAAGDGAAKDYFGRAVSLSGDRAVIGAYADDDNALNSGSAYVFERQLSGEWKQVAKLVASDGGVDDHFGLDVAINGDHVVIGAGDHDGKFLDSGAAYLFERQAGEGWTQVAKFADSKGKMTDYFGFRVAVSGDQALVSVIGDDDKGVDSGSAYIFNVGGGCKDGKCVCKPGYGGEDCGDLCGKGHSCDDKNPCTTDSCDEVKGCQAVNVKDETSCSQDGKKWCQAGKCVAAVVCGDGKVEGAEQCDDGGTKAGDGCSASCKFECASLRFDATDNFRMQIGNTAGWHLADQKTIEAWVKMAPGETNNDVMIVGKHKCGTPNGTFMGLWKDQLQGYPDPRPKGKAKLNDGKWHHLAIVHGVGVMHAYVDGVWQAKTGAKTYGNNNSLWNIGPVTGCGGKFRGRVASVRISKGMRYGGDFVPPALMEVDASTLGAWSFTGKALPNYPNLSGADSWAQVLGVAKVEKESHLCGGGVICGDGKRTAWEQCDDGNTKGGDGCSTACQLEPFPSCKAILTKFPNTPDGVYPIDPDGSGPLATRKMYCDMTTDGGGWSLVAALANRQPRKPAPAPFFTETLQATAADWKKSQVNPLLSTSGRGVLKMDHWPAPTAIRYRIIDTLTGAEINKMVIADPSSIQHMRQFTTARHKRTGKARATALKPAHTERVVYDANDAKAHWGYDATFGRFQDTSQAGWQFGVSVNLPDNQKGYDGVHDDKGRTELNLGVAGYQPWTADISSYWPGKCEKSCANEDWAIKMAAGRAVVEVWHTTVKAAYPSCKALLTKFPGTPDGVYPIDPDGAGPVAAANVFCDMKNGGWTLVGNYYDSAGDDMPNETKYVVSGWQQTGSGKWDAKATAVDRAWGSVSSAAVSMAFVAALGKSAGHKHLKMCFVHKDGYDTACRSSHDGTLTTVSYNTGNPKLTKYSGDKLTYTFGRLAGLAGSADGYDFKKYTQASYSVPRSPLTPISGWGESKGLGMADHDGTHNFQGVWHGYGCGISSRPWFTDDNELGGGSATTGCATKGANPSPDSYGFRLYVAP